jgi:hypothetical protein
VTTQPAIHVQGIEKSFHDLHVLRGVDFDVTPGSDGQAQHQAAELHWPSQRPLRQLRLRAGRMMSVPAATMVA